MEVIKAENFDVDNADTPSTDTPSTNTPPTNRPLSNALLTITKDVQRMLTLSNKLLVKSESMTSEELVSPAKEGVAYHSLAHKCEGVIHNLYKAIRQLHELSLRTSDIQREQFQEAFATILPMITTAEQQEETRQCA